MGSVFCWSKIIISIQCLTTKQFIIFVCRTNQKLMNQTAFHFRMQLASLRQYLRDNSENMEQEQIDKVLDQINRLTDLLIIIESDNDKK